MNKRMKKKWDKRVERVYIHNFERAYIVSLFEKLMNVYTDENQRWYPDGAWIAARLYTKKLLRRIHRSTLHITLKHDVNHILMAFTNLMRTPGNMEIKNLRIERMLEPFMVSVYGTMMDRSKQREELKKKLFNNPEFDALVKGLERHTEFMNSPQTDTPTNGLKNLYAVVDEFDTEDPVVISKSAAKKICESSDDVIRGHRLPDGWENEEFDNARKISDFNETLDGTFNGLMKYHERVAGSVSFADKLKAQLKAQRAPENVFMDKIENCTKFVDDEEKLKAISKEFINLAQGARWECDENGNPKKLISIDLCHNEE